MRTKIRTKVMMTFIVTPQHLSKLLALSLLVQPMLHHPHVQTLVFAHTNILLQSGLYISLDVLPSSKIMFSKRICYDFLTVAMYAVILNVLSCSVLEFLECFESQIERVES